MSEEEKPPEPVTLAKPEVKQGKYPSGHLFPEELLAQWVAIPETELVTIGPLSRADIDQLLFSTMDIARSIGELRDALIAYSNGQIENANIHLRNTLSNVVDGETRNRLLFEAIIKSVVKGQDNGSK